MILHCAGTGHNKIGCAEDRYCNVASERCDCALEGDMGVPGQQVIARSAASRAPAEVFVSDGVRKKARIATSTLCHPGNPCLRAPIIISIRKYIISLIQHMPGTIPSYEFKRDDVTDYAQAAHVTPVRRKQ